MTKAIRPLADDPMPALDILHLEARKEAADHRQSFVRNVGALRAPDEQRRSFVAVLVRIGIRKMAHAAERSFEGSKRNAEAQSLRSRRSSQIGEEELPDGERLGMFEVVS